MPLLVRFTLFLFAIISTGSFLDLSIYNDKFHLFKLLTFLLFSSICSLAIFTKKSFIISKKQKYLISSFVLFILLLIPNIFYAEDIIRAISVLFSYLILGMVAFLFFPITILQIDEANRQFTKIWFWSIVIIIIIGLLYALIDPDHGIKNYGPRGIRFVGGFLHPNFLASFVMLNILAAFRLGKIVNRWYWVILPPLLLLLWFTKSRAPILTLIVFGIVYLLHGRFSRGSYIFYALCTVGLLIAGGSYLSAHDMLLYTTDSISSKRISIWTQALSDLQGAEWLVGKGFGYSSEFQLGRTVGVGIGSTSFDNSFVNILVQAGALGLIGLILMATIAVLTVRKDRFVLALLVGAIAYGCLESSFYTIGNPFSVFVWLQVGLSSLTWLQVKTLGGLFMHDIVVNNRILKFQITGVQRYLHEMISRFGDSVETVAPGRMCDGVWGHVWEQGILPCQLKGRLLWSPSNTGPLAVEKQVVTIHDVVQLDQPDGLNPLFANWYQFLIPCLVHRVRRVIAVSEFTRSRLLDITGIDPDRVITIHNGVDARFRVQPPDEISRAHRVLGLPSPHYVLSLCSLVSRKNLHRLLQAWEQIQNKVADDIWLVIAGAQGKRLVFESLSFDRLPSRVFLAGYVPDECVPALYSGALVFAYPSIYEGFGLPPLEAMASGTPPLTGNRTSLPEVVGDAGLMVDPFDVEAIAYGIQRLIEDRILREELRMKGLQRAGLFSWDRTAELTLQVLEEMAASQ